MRLLFLCLLLACHALPQKAGATGETTGEFDYYLLALSWSPNWCALEGDARQSPQCDQTEDHGWIMHGLWPQFHRGFPSYCHSPERAPSRGMTAKMADIMGTSGLAWHQWKKHGSCTGLSAQSYYAISRAAYEAVVRPPVFRKVKEDIRLPASVVEDAFLKANPDMERGGITVTCKSGFIQDVRICLSKDLTPVPCGRDAIKDCTMNDALFTPIR